MVTIRSRSGAALPGPATIPAIPHKSTSEAVGPSELQAFTAKKINNFHLWKNEN